MALATLAGLLFQVVTAPASSELPPKTNAASPPSSVAPAAAAAGPSGTGTSAPNDATRIKTVESQPRTLSLAQAIQRAIEHQPQIQQAHASSLAAQARVDQSFAGLLPQVTGTASYQRATSNFTPRPGYLGGPGAPAAPSFNTYDYFNFGLTGSIVVYDFGQVRGKWHAAEASASSQEASEYSVRQQVMLSVRTVYFQVRAQKALLEVARETLGNQERHLTQIQGFVELGARPEIDLAQARADRATAEVQVINARNAYDTAQAQLSQAIGDDEFVEYDLNDASIPPVAGEEGPVDRLVEVAMTNRPDLLALRRQEEALRRTVSAVKGAYGPSLSVSTGVTEAGRQLDAMAWNWNAQAMLSWPIFQGGITKAQVSEAEANVSASLAQARALRLQIRLEVEQARLSARAAKAASESAETAVINARVRYRLAEGRYETGVGNIIELGDAQLALSTALAQKAQSEYLLATARAQLLRATGQM